MELDRHRYNLWGILEFSLGDGRPSGEWRPIAISSAVNVVCPDLAYYQGDLWYRRRIEIPQVPDADFSWRLVFLGANCGTEALLDRVSLGAHLR